jgi:hypothetical protein
MTKSIELVGNCNQMIAMDADKEVPMRTESTPHTHLRRPGPSLDLSCPGLMLTANASLVLGYLWVGWLSDGSQSGPVIASVRGVVLPVLVALAVLAIRLSCSHRGLPGGTLLLPFAATVELGVAVAADVSGNDFLLSMTAGGTALLVAFLAMVTVLRRETRSVRRLPALPEPTPTTRVTSPSLGSGAYGRTDDRAERSEKFRHLVMH